MYKKQQGHFKNKIFINNVERPKTVDLSAAKRVDFLMTKEDKTWYN